MLAIPASHGQVPSRSRPNQGTPVGLDMHTLTVLEGLLIVSIHLNSPRKPSAPVMVYIDP